MLNNVTNIDNSEDGESIGDYAMQPQRYKMNFEDCVLNQDPACNYPIGSKCNFRDGEKSFWSQVSWIFESYTY